MKWLAQTTIYRDSVDLLAVIDEGEMRSIVQPVIFKVKTQPRHVAVSMPTLELPPASARSLMQALWDAGIRPADWSSQGGEISAMRRHVDFAEHVAKTLLTK